MNWDAVMRLFGGRPRRPPPTTDLAETRFKVAQTAEDLLERQRRQLLEVRKLKHSGQRTAAMIRLAASKQTTAHIDHCHTIIASLDSVTEVEEMARVNQLGVAAFRDAAASLRAMLATLDADKVAAVQTDLDALVREANEVQRETGRAIPALRGPVLDERALEQELDAMFETSSEEEAVAAAGTEEEEDEEERQEQTAHRSSRQKATAAPAPIVLLSS